VRKTLVLALAAVLCLSLVATALAQRGDPKNTTNKLTVKVSPNKSGSAKKPKPVNFTLGIAGGTKNGQGQPASSTSLNTTLPSGLKINSKSWPKSKSCDLKKMRAQKSPKAPACPKGATPIGKGISIAKAGTLTENLKVTAYSLTNGNVGFYLLGNPVPLNKTLEGKVVKNGRGLNVVIDPDVYQPVTGLFTGITKLEVKFTGRAKVDGKTIGAVSSVKCPKSKKWDFGFQNVLLGGGKINNKTSIACK
jgi:hypothetical protein